MLTYLSFIDREAQCSGKVLSAVKVLETHYDMYGHPFNGMSNGGYEGSSTGKKGARAISSNTSSNRNYRDSDVGLLPRLDRAGLIQGILSSALVRDACMTAASSKKCHEVEESFKKMIAKVRVHTYVYVFVKYVLVNI